MSCFPLVLVSHVGLVCENSVILFHIYVERWRRGQSFSTWIPTSVPGTLRKKEGLAVQDHRGQKSSWGREYSQSGLSPWED